MRFWALAATALALAGCAHNQQLPQSARYVAVGSSFAAGTALGGIKPDTPKRCGRSPNSYASLLAKRLNLTLDDQSCGGATTAHILGNWSELPPQIDAVNAATRLVTLTIGGNDLNYVGNLFGATCKAEVGFTYQGVKRPCPQLRVPTEENYASLDSNLRAIAREVHNRAPKAQLVFVQYVKLVPDAPCSGLELSAEGASLTRIIGERLAVTTARAAAAEGAKVLSVDTLSSNHTACDAAPWSVGPKPLGPDANAPWHPTTAGHAAIADALAKMLRH